MSDYRQKFITSVHDRCEFVDASFDTPVVECGCLLPTSCQPYRPMNVLCLPRIWFSLVYAPVSFGVLKNRKKTDPKKPWAQIINNSAADCSISLKICCIVWSLESRCTTNVKVRGQRWKSYTTYHQWKRYKSGTDRLTETRWKLSRSGAQHVTQVHIIRSIIEVAITQRRLHDFSKIYYVVWPRHTRYTTNVQGQRVKGRGQSVT